MATQHYPLMKLLISHLLFQGRNFAFLYRERIMSFLSNFFKQKQPPTSDQIALNKLIQTICIIVSCFKVHISTIALVDYLSSALQGCSLLNHPTLNNFGRHFLCLVKIFILGLSLKILILKDLMTDCWILFQYSSERQKFLSHF